VNNELFAPLLFQGYCNSEIYFIYLKQVLIPALKPGQIVVIDNASFHKSKKITELVEKAQCKILFLPPYSPHFNPIEHLWAPLKKKIRVLFSSSQDFYDAAVQTLSIMCNH
jgi:transposase